MSTIAGLLAWMTLCICFLRFYTACRTQGLDRNELPYKGRLLFTPGVMVTSVPYQLRSSELAHEREMREESRVHAGDLRRGRVARSSDRQVDR